MENHHNHKPRAPDLHSLPAGTHPTNAVRNNGPNELVLERFKLRELAEGWPLYRYAASFSTIRWPRGFPVV
jgi:hypothetical protein